MPMKILVLMKRFGVKKDMVLSRFGRQHNLFHNLARKGHKIDFVCFDYVKFDRFDLKKGGLAFHVRPYYIIDHFTSMSFLKNMVKNNNYDWIVSSTDPLIGVIGYGLSRNFKINHIYEMQDDYSLYSSIKIPFVKSKDLEVVKNSEIVVTVSDSLREKIRKLRVKPTFTIQNGVDIGSFRTKNKEYCRKLLKLPAGKIIIYTGEISKFKGIGMLLKAFSRVRKYAPDSYLLLSGPIHDINVKQENVIYREYPKRWEVIHAMNAADVGVIPNPVNEFSKYCYPYKMAEYMACGLQIVSTDVGDAGRLLSKYPGSICKPDDEKDMADKIIGKLKLTKKVNYDKVLKNLTWENLGNKLDKILRAKYLLKTSHSIR